VRKPWWAGETEEERLAAMIDEVRLYMAAVREAGLTSEQLNEMTFARSPNPRGGDLMHSGKWMVFCSPAYHAEVWGKIKAGTEAGTLGDAAKTVPPLVPQRALLTCVYTYDYEDHEDVCRVLGALRELGFSGRLNYKRDADTGLNGIYGEGASIYVSQPGTLDFEDRREQEAR
jgi:hypothetical protein